MFDALLDSAGAGGGNAAATTMTTPPSPGAAAEEYLRRSEVEAAELLAWRREQFLWGAAAIGLGSAVWFCRSLRRRSPISVALGPLLPGAYVAAWGYDASWGRQDLRVRDKAELIMRYEAARLRPPEAALAAFKAAATSAAPPGAAGTKR